MGSFSNGSEGDQYEEQYCHKCVHWISSDIGCPVWMAHELWNYDECNKPDSILHKMIPLTKDGLFNEQCTFFRPKGA